MILVIAPTRTISISIKGKKNNNNANANQGRGIKAIRAMDPASMTKEPPAHFVLADVNALTIKFVVVSCEK
jgi:hypothetical protein